MASVRLNGDTSGFIEISAPSVAGSTTITLPATSGGDFLVTDSNGDLNVDSGTLFVDASTNRVGIGTTSPTMNLEVSGNQPTVRINTTTTGYTGLEYSTNGTTDGGIYYNGTDDRMEFYTADTTGDPQTVIDGSGRLLVRTNEFPSGTAATAVFKSNSAGVYGARLVLQHTTTTPNSGDDLGLLQFTDGSTSSLNEAARIGVFRDGGTWTSGSSHPGRLVFYTTPNGASSSTERMRIQSNGAIQFQNTSEFYCNPNNSSTLGRSANRWSAVWASNGTIQTSDERLKTEVTNSSLASDFIKALRPVSYKWIEGGKRHTGEYDEDNNWVYESTPGQRTHWGFIAQEVKQVADDAGVDFGGWVLEDKDDPESTQSLRYDQFIAPLTKALQEALAKIETLEQRLSDAGIA